MAEWKPMEFAPKDGTSVLGFFPTRGGYVARQDMIPMHWCGWGGGIWQNSTSGHNIIDEPSCWQELPDPPAHINGRSEYEQACVDFRDHVVNCSECSTSGHYCGKGRRLFDESEPTEENHGAVSA